MSDATLAKINEESFRICKSGKYSLLILWSIPSNFKSKILQSFYEHYMKGQSGLIEKANYLLKNLKYPLPFAKKIMRWIIQSSQAMNIGFKHKKR